ncbi:MAG: DUF3300 domain-containing protein [Nitrospirota bacterium]
MKSTRMIIQALTLMIFSVLVLPPGIPAQEYVVETEQDDVFKKEELAQMLAPIALYPDSLITQILMASTYPLEVVEAERWLLQNKDLTGDALNDALQKMNWDFSVKSLCHFPDVLTAMSEKLVQTRKLGDAFLSQEKDVMATIQELRQKAYKQGNLKTTKEQKIIIEREIIRVEPANLQVVYVPIYNPVYVYGQWRYSAYPPWYWYYPRSVAVIGRHIHFGSGYFIGIGIYSWSWFDWHRHYIYIDINKAGIFHAFLERHDSDCYSWKHNPRHRRGVAYINRKTSERFSPELARLQKTRPEMRGYASKGFEREKIPAGSSLNRRAGDVPRVITQPEKSGSLIGSRGKIAPQFTTQRKSDQKVQHRDTPFRGSGNGNFERKAGERAGYSLHSYKKRS